jgi:hypothetical protein
MNLRAIRELKNKIIPPKTAEQMLDELAALNAAYADAIRPLQAQLDKLLDKIATAAPELHTAIDDLEQRIKVATLERGATVAGQSLQCIFISGKATWDTKGLEGFAKAVDARILEFKHVGKPSVYLKPKGGQP